MSLIRRLFGLIALLFGLVGFVLFIAAIGLLWLANSRVKDRANQAIEPAQKTLTFAQTQLEKADGWIVAMRSRLDNMKTQVDQLASIDPAALGENLDRVELDHEAISYNLERADLLVSMSRESIGTLSELTAMVESVPIAAVEEYSDKGPLATEIKQADEQLEDFAEIFQQVRASLSKARSQQAQLNPQTLRELSGDLERAAAKLAEVHDTVIQFRLTVRKTAEDVSKVQESAPTWIDRGSWILTAILVWLGISQYTLIVYGQALMKSA